MKIAFRLDSSRLIGGGHLMRCLALAEKLRGHGATCNFVCRNQEGNLNHLVKQNGYTLFELPIPPKDNSLTGYAEWLGVSWERDWEEFSRISESNSFDIVVMDHYGLDAKWHHRARKKGLKIVVIDELANRDLSCELLVDNGFYKNSKTRYAEQIEAGTKVLLGPEYSLLRKEFEEAQPKAKGYENGLKSVLLFFGAGDPTGEILKTLRAILSNGIHERITFHVIVGPINKSRSEIEALAAHQANIKLYPFSNEVAALMEKVDLGVGAGGLTTWERLHMGLPNITISVAHNQEECAIALHEQNFTFYLGDTQKVSGERIVEQLIHCVGNIDELREMSKRSIQLVDGRGAQRVAEAILSL